jgi:hypothetical protein
VAGKIKQTIEKIIEQRSKGNQTIRNTTEVKLILKGINPDKYTQDSPDNPEILAKLQQIASEMGVNL